VLSLLFIQEECRCANDLNSAGRLGEANEEAVIITDEELGLGSLGLRSDIALRKESVLALCDAAQHGEQVFPISSALLQKRHEEADLGFGLLVEGSEALHTNLYQLLLHDLASWRRHTLVIANLVPLKEKDMLVLMSE
jgi:hypothetical protein